MRHLFIINPAAGKGNAYKYADEIKKHFDSTNEPYIIEYTKGPGDATKIAQKYVTSDQYRVYAIGGDGTLNEVLNGVVGSSSSLAVIPSGSGNDFHRNLDITNDSSLFLRTINGEEKYIDIGKVNDRYFLNVSSVGLDATVVNNAKLFKKLPFFNGRAAYFTSVFYTLFKFKSFTSKLTIDNTEHSMKTCMMAVANGKYYGGGIKIAPLAQINDGFFDIYHVKKLTPLKALALFPRLLKATHQSLKEVDYFKAKTVRIQSNENFLLSIDGELVETKEASFDIISNGLKIIVPKINLGDS